MYLDVVRPSSERVYGLVDEGKVEATGKMVHQRSHYRPAPRSHQGRDRVILQHQAYDCRLQASPTFTNDTPAEDLNHILAHRSDQRKVRSCQPAVQSDTMNATASAKPLASYSAARAVRIGPNLQLLYVSGTTARQPDGRVPPFGMEYDGALHASLSLGASAAATQADIIISKIEAVIREMSGGTSGLEALMDLTVFVKDLKRDYGAVNEVYNARVGALFKDRGVPLPARTCIQVGAMPPDERALVEIKATAVLGGY